MEEVFIVDFLRLPVGKKGGLYKDSIPEDFTAHLLKGLIKKQPDLPNRVDLVSLATAVGTGGNMARYISLNAGFPVTVPACTIDAQCVGSYQSISDSFAYIRSGMADVVIVGGFESNSLLPERKFNSLDPRFSSKPYVHANFAPPDFGVNSLIETARQTAKKNEISKSEMIEWSILSNKRADETVKTKLLESAIFPFNNTVEDQTRKDINLLKRFKNRKELIDASTSCLFDDGAGVLVLASKSGCEKLQTNPRFKILTAASVGIEPKNTPLAFVEAVKKTLSQIKLKYEDIDLFEINESFALKPILLNKLLQISEDRINILGGNLAFGHPFGASGAINLIHLLLSLQKGKKEMGLVAASAAGGIGSSIIVQQIS